MSRFESWGRYPKIDQKAKVQVSRTDALPADCSWLPFGNGRSYGDSCLNANGVVLSSQNLKHFIAFDHETGVLRCEAGVTLAEIIDLVLPHGWFLPVTPGTKFVTVGGAIGNDVHGKNHHVHGTFGEHVRCFELLRSSGERLLCSEDENSDYFAATIGGLGLTGFISWAELQLRPVNNYAIEQENIKYQNLDEFFKLSEDSDQDYEYTVAWVDCLATGNALGRGHFTRGNHAKKGVRLPKAKVRNIPFPITPPVSLVNKYSLKWLNRAYYHRQLSRSVTSCVHYDPFFYPLDSILNWNRAYGPKGFLQYQCAIPTEHARDAMRELLERIALSGMGSLLVVLKVFGKANSPGWLSYPLEGANLALDFPYIDDRTHNLLTRLDEVVMQTGGRVYPAKDAHMSAEQFQHYYPKWKDLRELKDPNIDSSFWRRVTADQQ